MKKRIITIFLILFFALNAFAAVDRVIDPEIPIDETIVNYEQNFDDVLISLLAVTFLSFGTVSGAALILLLSYFFVKGISIF
ncbi:hypothetical protein LCGC14_0943460 [marine sediment metagenome]|uniref:Uncharacterized protein n=1 Tax=marine sediment metagenome TaxID=412755 RepID=A0A0F9NP28_9ZZZZ